MPMPFNATVLDRRRKDETSDVILCKIENSVTPYVTWRQGKLDKGCYWGHYFTDFLEACTDYERR